ncbi:hypothetical protein MFLAVUS_004548 [Mucor flavus]|uniref:Methyltransferase domain-containing protein n=1 Tax=Mucor flavus TaxID=439312 RepID=A0ABP9YW70_9FUNG
MDNQASDNISTDGNNELKTYSGRKYHDNEKVAYLLPEDSDESSRLNKQHIVLRYFLQKNFIAPIDKQLEEGITVLDSGCGPASWLFDMAKDYPNSKFYGVDITNTFPEEEKPENCELVLGNIGEHIPFPDNTFDYVHQRLLLLGLTEEMWEQNIKELFRVLKPGGCIEIKEPDLRDLCNMGPLLNSLQEAMSGMLSSRGMPLQISTELEGRITDAGFENIDYTIFNLNLNHNGKAGEMLWDDYYHGYMNIRPVMATIHPAYEDLDAYKVFLTECSAEAAKLKTDIQWHTVVAKKPLN